MSSTSDKIKGYANEAAGSVKKGVGEVVGSEKLQAEGAMQKAKGEAQKAVGDVKDAAATAYGNAKASSTADTLKGYGNEAAGKVKQGLGKLAGSEQLEAEGLAQEVEGRAQKVSGDIKRSVGN